MFYSRWRGQGYREDCESTATCLSPPSTSQ